MMEAHECQGLKDHAEHGSHESAMRPVARMALTFGLVSALVAFGVAAGAAQSPAPQDPATAFGFTYHLPGDWHVIESKPPAPLLQQEQETAKAEEKKGIGCLEVPYTARHDEPPTTVVIDALPYACFGQKLGPQDLSSFGAGVAEGLKQISEVTGPIEVQYTLAGHTMWIQRARATPKGRTFSYTIEIVCTLLSKAAVCWLVQAPDEAGLHVFEQAPVTLDGVLAPALVPANVFVKNK